MGGNAALTPTTARTAKVYRAAKTFMVLSVAMQKGRSMGRMDNRLSPALKVRFFISFPPAGSARSDNGPDHGTAPGSDMTVVQRVHCAAASIVFRRMSGVFHNLEDGCFSGAQHDQRSVAVRSSSLRCTAVAVAANIQLFNTATAVCHNNQLPNKPTAHTHMPMREDAVVPQAITALSSPSPRGFQQYPCLIACIVPPDHASVRLHLWDFHRYRLR